MTAFARPITPNVRRIRKRDDLSPEADSSGDESSDGESSDSDVDATPTKAIPRKPQMRKKLKKVR